MNIESPLYIEINDAYSISLWILKKKVEKTPIFRIIVTTIITIRFAQVLQNWDDPLPLHLWKA